ncbi:MAG: hypothetical protein ABGW98_22605 [Myxococcales bacterium]
MNRNSVAAKTAGVPYVLIVQKDLEDREAVKPNLFENRRPMTRRHVPAILERLGKLVERKGYEMRLLRCGVVDVGTAIETVDWNKLFAALIPWDERHTIGGV